MPIPPTSRAVWRNPLLLSLLLVAAGTLLLAVYQYFTGDDATLPVQVVSHLKSVPTTLTAVRVGLSELPIQVNNYLLTQTHDMVGPYVQPEAAWLLLGLLAGMLVVFLAVVSTLERPAFVAGMAGVIFLLMSLNADLLGIFNSQEQYFLMLALVALGVPAYVFHAFRTEASLSQRLLVFAVLIGGLSTLLVFRSTLSPDETALHLTSFATLGGAVIVGLVVLWVGFENIQGLLWFNTQAENPNSRFGLLPFVASSALYLGMMAMYLWNGSQLLILPGVFFDPLVLLLPAAVIGWLGLQRRAASYGDVLPYWPAAAHLYLVFFALAAGFLGYAFATANDPLLLAARQFTALTFLIGGAAFLLYVLVNFGPLIRQRLRVYRVVYEPRRLPLYAVYVLTVAGLAALEFRYSYETLHQVQAGYYNNLADLTRLQSELNPNGDALALLAERYYAESDILDEHNHKASLGRAALYRYRLQRQNEINILRRALSRRPSEKISLRLAALYNEPTDFFDRLAALREGLKSQPTSARLNNDLAQLYTRSTLTDSVAVYLNRAEAAAANPVVKVNQLAFLLQTEQLDAAQQLVQSQKQLSDVAWQSNVLVLAQRRPDVRAVASSSEPDAASLTVPEFARFYHAALYRVQQHDTSALPVLTQLIQQPDNSSYFEQLTFLKALTQHYGGQILSAYTTLSPLTAGATPSAAYYQNVRGLWQLQQQTYSLAAATLRDAAQNGYSEAYLHRAYALALNQQPDSARVATARVVQEPDTLLARSARQIQRILTLKFPDGFQAASETEQTQFYVLRGQEALNGPGYLDGHSWYSNYIEKMRQPLAHDVALLAQARRVAGSNPLEAATVLQAHSLRSRTPSLASEYNVVYGQALLAARSQASLQQLETLLKSATFLPADQPSRLYLQAALASYQKQPKQATQLYQQLVRTAPYLEPGMLAAAAFYTSQKEYLTAYSTLQAALEQNPESVSLLKAYVLASVPAGLTEYAANSLEKLRVLLSPAEYATFRTIYLAHRTSQDTVVAPWN
ncbi:hypothetical protein [Hymenobacter norwichensis]|uniref:hypothetical protein n=1 Tax=Hymenobacter norwichensis TaxID=223903 RepID=UPI0003B3EE46|nr:hypothetical protein [Hymenobacter norwichensis]